MMKSFLIIALAAVSLAACGSNQTSTTPLDYGAEQEAVLARIVDDDPLRDFYLGETVETVFASDFYHCIVGRRATGNYIVLRVNGVNGHGIRFVEGYGSENRRWGLLCEELW